MRSVIKSILIITQLTLLPTVTYASVKDSVSAFDYYIEGVREYAAGESSSADIMFFKSVRMNPENDAAWYYMAMLRLMDNDSDKALEYLEKAVSLSPDNQWYRLTSARLYANLGESDKAIDIYNALITEAPEKSDYYYELTDLLMRSNRLDEALGILERIDQLRGATEITGNAKYEILMAQGRYDEAEKQARKLDENFPSPRTALALGDLYKARYNDSTALYYYRKAVNMDPEFTPAYLGMAEVYRINRDFFNFFKSINIFLSDRDMNPLMKASYIEEVIFPSGIVPVFRPQVDTLINNTLNAHPSDTAILSMAGSYFIALDSIDKGLELLRRNVDLHPDVKSARMAYMGQLYYTRQWDTLIPVAQRTIELFPEHFSLKEILAIAYWQKGDTEAAAGLYRQILKVIPENHPMLISCYGSLGDLYHELGNRRKAYRYYEKGLRIDDNYSPILNNYAYYLSEEGRNLRKALEMSRKTVLNEPENPTYLDTYGWLLYLTGDYQEARKYLEKAKIYGGDESAVILDHYAETLYALKEYNLAFLYWGNAERLDPDMGLAEKVRERRKEADKR